MKNINKINAIGRLLAEARRRAGFASAAAAANAYGWSAVTVRAHERAARKISAIDAEKYALSFGLPVAALEDAEKAERELDKLLREPLPVPTTVQSDEHAGHRLKTVRLIRGFESVRAAADYFGFVQPTLIAHESGLNPMTRRNALGYAAAYGVSPEWLLSGRAPSGLGQPVEASMASVGDWESLDIRELRRLADVDGEKDTIGLRRLLRERNWVAGLGSDGDNIPEVSARQIGSDFSYEASESQRIWQLPKGLASSLTGSEAGTLVVLPLDYSHGGFAAGDRLFVDLTKRDRGSGGKFAYIVNGALRIVDESFGLSPFDLTQLLGQIVGAFTRLPTDRRSR
jgi:hypothetical protein